MLQSKKCALKWNKRHDANPTEIKRKGTKIFDIIYVKLCAWLRIRRNVNKSMIESFYESGTKDKKGIENDIFFYYLCSVILL